MHTGRFVFSELIARLPHQEFQKCVARYDDHPQPRKLSYRSEEHTSELQSLRHLVCRLLLEKKRQDRVMRCAAFPSLPFGGYNMRDYFAPWLSFAQLTDLVNFFFNDTATTEIYTLSLHDALPI